MPFLDQVKEFHSQGLTDYQIAALLGCSHNHIRQARQFKLGLKGVNRIKSDKIKQQIIELNAQGISDHQIAKMIGISTSSAQWHRSRLNLETPFPELTYETEEDRIRGYMIRNIKFSAKRRNIPFDITYRDLVLVEKCPLLDIPLKYRTEKGFNDNDRATVDRMDNTKGYVKGNVWILSRLANSMKNEATFDQLELFASRMLEFVENQRALGSITDSKSLDS